VTIVDDLLNWSHFVGKRIPHWTQGTGGNISVKQGDSLYIKASGTRLDQMSHERGVVEMNCLAIVSRLKDLNQDEASAETLYASLLQPKAHSLYNKGKPSMEAGMHAVLPQRWVFHFHSVVGHLLAFEFNKSKDKVNGFLRKVTSQNVQFVPALSPGWQLSKWILERPLADVYILENHGVLFHGEEDAVLQGWISIENEFLGRFRYKSIYEPYQNAPTPLKLYFPDSAVFLDRLKRVIIPIGGEDNIPLYQLSDDAKARDPDVAEIWEATEILYRACPQLPELPDHLSKSIPKLPTELYRKAIK
jgi:rhamnose utilization protein RhaD (predicted bifunctional aldolase and dehydrogenase)